MEKQESFQILPQGLSEQTWQHFREHRKQLKAKMTELAETLILAKLEKLRQQGEDPTEVVHQSIEVDHLIPISRGGNDERSNLAPACGPCNRSKRDLTPEEFRDRLKDRLIDRACTVHEYARAMEKFIPGGAGVHAIGLRIDDIIREVSDMDVRFFGEEAQNKKDDMA